MARGKKKFVTLADHEAEEKAAADSIAVTKVLEDNGNELQSKLTTYPQNAVRPTTKVLPGATWASFLRDDKRAKATHRVTSPTALVPIVPISVPTARFPVTPIAAPVAPSPFTPVASLTTLSPVKKSNPRGFVSLYESGHRRGRAWPSLDARVRPELQYSANVQSQSRRYSQLDPPKFRAPASVKVPSKGGVGNDLENTPANPKQVKEQLSKKKGHGICRQYYTDAPEPAILETYDFFDVRHGSMKSFEEESRLQGIAFYEVYPFYGGRFMGYHFAQSVVKTVAEKSPENSSPSKTVDWDKSLEEGILRNQTDNRNPKKDQGDRNPRKNKGDRKQENRKIYLKVFRALNPLVPAVRGYVFIANSRKTAREHAITTCSVTGKVLYKVMNRRNKYLGIQVPREIAKKAFQFAQKVNPRHLPPRRRMLEYKPKQKTKDASSPTSPSISGRNSALSKNRRTRVRFLETDLSIRRKITLCLRALACEGPKEMYDAVFNRCFKGKLNKSHLNAPFVDRCRMALIAHIRHDHTEYDKIANSIRASITAGNLKAGRRMQPVDLTKKVRAEAKSKVKDAISTKWLEWGGKGDPFKSIIGKYNEAKAEVITKMYLTQGGRFAAKAARDDCVSGDATESNAHNHPPSANRNGSTTPSKRVLRVTSNLKIQIPEQPMQQLEEVIPTSDFVPIPINNHDKSKDRILDDRLRELFHRIPARFFLTNVTIRTPIGATNWQSEHAQTPIEQASVVSRNNEWIDFDIPPSPEELRNVGTIDTPPQFNFSRLLGSVPKSTDHESKVRNWKGPDDARAVDIGATYPSKFNRSISNELEEAKEVEEVEIDIQQRLTLNLTMQRRRAFCSTKAQALTLKLHPLSSPQAQSAPITPIIPTPPPNRRSQKNIHYRDSHAKKSFTPKFLHPNYTYLDAFPNYTHLKNNNTECHHRECKHEYKYNYECFYKDEPKLGMRFIPNGAQDGLDVRYAFGVREDGVMEGDDQHLPATEEERKMWGLDSGKPQWELNGGSNRTTTYFHKTGMDLIL